MYRLTVQAVLLYLLCKNVFFYFNRRKEEPRNEQFFVLFAICYILMALNELLVPMPGALNTLVVVTLIMGSTRRGLASRYILKSIHRCALKLARNHAESNSDLAEACGIVLFCIVIAASNTMVRIRFVILFAKHVIEQKSSLLFHLLCRHEKKKV